MLVSGCLINVRILLITSDEMLNIFNNRIKLNSQKLIANFELWKSLDQSILVLTGIFIFFNPFPHTTAIKEISFYLSVFIVLILIISKKNNFTFKTPLLIPFGLFVFWAFIGLFFAIDKKNSIHDFYSHLLRYIILYYVIINYFNSKKLLSRLSWIIIISTTFFSLGSITYLYFILENSLSSRLGSYANTVLSQIPLNVISILTLFAIILAFYKLFTEKALLYRQITLVFCISILFVAVLLTRSSAAYAAIAMASIPLSPKNQKHLIVYIGIVFVGIILLVSFFSSSIKDRILYRLNFDPRIPIMYVTMEVVKEHPITGVGFGLQTYGKLDLKEYQKKLPAKYHQSGEIVTDPHNMVLDIAVRLGVVGLLLFFYIIFVFFKMCWDIIKYGKDDFIKNWGYCLAAAFIAVSVIGLFQPIFSHMPEVVICTIFSMTTVVWRLNNLREEGIGDRKERLG